MIKDKDYYNDTMFFHVNRELKEKLKKLTKEQKSKLYLEMDKAIKSHIDLETIKLKFKNEPFHSGPAMMSNMVKLEDYDESTKDS